MKANGGWMRHMSTATGAEKVSNGYGKLAGANPDLCVCGDADLGGSFYVPRPPV